MRRLIGLLASIIRATSLVALVVMIIVVVMQVSARYVFRRPVGWSEEVALATMVWITFFGSFLAFVEKKHMRITLLFSILGRSAQRATLFVGNLVVVVLNVFVVHYGLQFAVAFRNMTSPYLGIPLFYQYMIIPLASMLWILYLLVECIEVLRDSGYWTYKFEE